MNDFVEKINTGENFYKVSYPAELARQAAEAKERMELLDLVITCCPPYPFTEVEGKFQMTFDGELLKFDAGRVARTALPWPVAYLTKPTAIQCS